MMDAHNGRLEKGDLIWRGQEKGEEGKRLEGRRGKKVGRKCVCLLPERVLAFLSSAAALDK